MEHFRCAARTVCRTRHPEDALLRIVANAVAILFAAAASLAAQTPVQQGKALMDARKYAEAKVVLQPLGATDATAAFYLGQIAMEENDGANAAAWLEKAVAMNPRSSIYYDWLGRAYGMQAQRASKLKLPFLAGRTRSAWEKAIALDPNNLDARQDMILYYMQAPGFLGGGKDKARAMAEEIRRRNPYRGAVSSIRICSDAKDQACLERELSFLVSNYPDSSAGYTSLASFYVTAKQYEKAFAVIDQRLKARPTDAAALYAYGRTASLTGQNLERGEQALKLYIAAPIPTGPSVAHAHYRLGLIEEKKGARDLARREYETALRLDPGQQDATKALAALSR
jgi:tetratricopeptide (TPR) repeat protein